MSGQEKYKGVAFLPKPSDPKDGLAKVTLKISSLMDQSWPGISVNEVMVPPGTSVYNLMLQAAHDGAVEFEAVWSGKNWSHFIYSINGLKELQPAAESYTVWGFGDGERNRFHRDVDLVSVKDGDTIEFLYTRFK
ncbi:uncharacterized protein [Branchiostoma lanceolatum]|uniref:uncharacterized protein n=1 Tax=Branchiostoma lanceolatum TaxID=7740 RepID=UPI0034540FBA